MLDNDIPCAFQFTITGYDRWFEPHALPITKIINNFLECSKMLPGPACIEWRYDPIIICEKQPAKWHIHNFKKIAAALQGATRVVNISFVEPYLKTVRRLNAPGVLFRNLSPERHRTVLKRFPNLPQIPENIGKALVLELTSIAKEYGIECRMCANPEWGAQTSQCCGVDLFTPYGSAKIQPLKTQKKGPSRPSCNCLKSVDIGMDNSCINGCRYCYVVLSQELAVNNYRNHLPTALMLRGKSLSNASV